MTALCSVMRSAFSLSIACAVALYSPRSSDAQPVQQADVFSGQGFPTFTGGTGPVVEATTLHGGRSSSAMSTQVLEAGARVAVIEHLQLGLRVPFVMGATHSGTTAFKCEHLGGVALDATALIGRVSIRGVFVVPWTEPDSYTACSFVMHQVADDLSTERPGEIIGRGAGRLEAAAAFRHASYHSELLAGAGLSPRHIGDEDNGDDRHPFVRIGAAGGVDTREAQVALAVLVTAQDESGISKRVQVAARATRWPSLAITLFIHWYPNDATGENRALGASISFEPVLRSQPIVLD